MAFVIMFTTSCTTDDDDDTDPIIEPLEAQTRVQVAYDAVEVAFKFVWKSQSKTMPEGFAQVGKKYPGQFHDVLKHNGTKFDRLPSDARMQEDRISFMIDRYEGGIPGFSKATCAATCHTGMARHHILTDNLLDHWHWRGQRSGPMGYAEDAAINNVERIRDDLGSSPSNFIRSGGDRLREDQPALTGSGHAVLEDGFPRFVFNKGKAMENGYVVPNYFISDEGNQVVQDPYAEFPNIKDVSTNRSLLVVHQDMGFDGIDKVNAIDLAYLAYVALSSVDHLPDHLQDTESSAFTNWKSYWSSTMGINETETQKAADKLDEVHQEWLDAGKNAMIGRSVGFIYNSDQHDIRTVHDYNTSSNEWTVIMYRRLNTGSEFDANLSGLPNGTKYAFSFAMHDLGGAGISHHFSMPLVISNADDTDIQAVPVTNVNDVNWGVVPYYDAYYVKTSLYDKWTEDWLRGASHPGAGVFTTSSCISCHDHNLTYSSVLP